MKTIVSKYNRKVQVMENELVNTGRLQEKLKTDIMGGENALFYVIFMLLSNGPITLKILQLRLTPPPMTRVID